MDLNETRILQIPASRSKYAIVSIPKTSWYWLDDLVERHYPAGGYKALVQAFADAKCPESLSSGLRRKAREHCETQMATLYSLANDNRPVGGYPELAPSGNRDILARMPTVYRLFHFMPHAAALTTVWERRNYHLRGEFL